jgi:hypothetical protein
MLEHFTRIELPEDILLFLLKAKNLRSMENILTQKQTLVCTLVQFVSSNFRRLQERAHDAWPFFFYLNRLPVKRAI